MADDATTQQTPGTPTPTEEGVISYDRSINPTAGDEFQYKPPAQESPSEITPETPSTPAEVTEYGQQFGFSPEELQGFESVEDLRTAIREEFRQRGQQARPPADDPQQGASPPNRQTQDVSASQQTDLASLELDEDDAAAKAIRALEQRIVQQGKEFQEWRDQQEQTAREQAIDQVMAEATAVIDGFKSDRYGVGRQRNFAQRRNAERLWETFKDVYRTSRAQGKQTSVQDCMEIARLLDEGPPKPEKSAEPVLRKSGQPAQHGEQKVLSMTDSWRYDPGFRRKFGLPPAEKPY